MGPYDKSFGSSMFAHLVAISGMAFGSVLADKFFPLNASIFDHISRTIEGFSKGPFVFATVVLCLLSVIGHLSAYGWEGLLLRKYYIADADGWSILAQISNVLGVLFSAVLLSGEKKAIKYVGFFTGVVLVFLAFAKGSRYAVLSIGLLVIFPALIRPSGKFKARHVLYIFLTLVFMGPMLHAMLYFRQEDTYGVLAYVSGAQDAFSSLLEDDAQAIWNLLFNVGLSIPVTQVTIELGPHKISDFLISISPLGGDAAGWYEIARYRRYSEDVPYSAMGELFGISPVVCFVYMVIAACLFGYLELLALRTRGEMRLVGVTAIIMFGLLFSLFVLQYNLRNATRLLYYTALIVASIYGVSKLRFSRS